MSDEFHWAVWRSLYSVADFLLIYQDQFVSHFDVAAWSYKDNPSEGYYHCQANLKVFQDVSR